MNFDFASQINLIEHREMRFRFAVYFLMIAAMVGCADRAADLETADYLLAKGDKVSAASAKKLVEPIIAQATSEEKAEALRLYVGAQLILAGVTPVALIPAVVYRDTNNAVRLLLDVVTFSSDSDADLADAASKLQTYFATEDFAQLPGRTRFSLRTQLGFVLFFQALQTSFFDSGLLDLLLADVPNCLTDDQASSVASDLTNSQAAFEAGDLTSNNSFIDYIETIAAQIPSGVGRGSAYCSYLFAQRNAEI